MKLSSDSPELTSYALGELTPEENARVETALRSQPELLREVEAIRGVAVQLTRSLETAPKPALTPRQRSEIFAATAAISSSAENDHVGDTDGLSHEGSRPSEELSDALSGWRRWLSGAFLVPVGFAVALFVAGLIIRQQTRVPAGTGPLASSKDSRERTKDSIEARYPANRVRIEELSAESEDSKKLAVDSYKTDILVAEVPQTPAANSDLQRRWKEGVESKSGVESRFGVEAATAGSAKTTALGAADGSANPGLSSAAGNNDPIIAFDLAVAQAPTPRSAVDSARPILKEPTLMQRYGLRMPNAQAEGQSAGQPALRKMAESEEEKLAPFSVPVQATARARAAVSLERRGEIRSLEENRDKFYYKASREHRGLGTESYAAIHDNPFKDVAAHPLSTFSTDVDTASYSNVRRFLAGGSLPPPDAVRIEELINYFPYDYAGPRDGKPFAAHFEVADCPWNTSHRLARVALQAQRPDRAERPRANLIFLLDTSGSMQPENKLPLVKRSMRLLLDQLQARDSVGIVTYAGEAKIALTPTPAGEKSKIVRELDSLEAGSGTHGSAGIQQAYTLARAHFLPEGVNRVILCTDGDFNIGVTRREDLIDLISREAKSGVFLSVLGFGMGNTKDDTMELLADKGNGNYAYIDSFREARKVLIEQLEGTLVTVAKDVKIQMEFNPARVASYRLLGYENRILQDRDFNDDTKDAGEVGAGHSVTAVYEIVPAGGARGPGVDPLRYAPANREPVPVTHADELFLLKVRYKQPGGDKSELISWPVKDNDRDWEVAGKEFKFTAAVAGYGMMLRNSPYKGDITWEKVLRMAEEGMGSDVAGYRAEFVDLIRKAQSLSGGR